MNAQTLGDDQDSLFGSPPSSPQIRVRELSPALALPKASDSLDRSSTSTAVEKNVGIIALPGSQHFSELPINPLALSLNHGVVSRPPASNPQTQPQSVANGENNDPGPAKRAPSKPSSSGTKRKRKESGPQSQPHSSAEFSLPDPQAPPLKNFLRQQQNLLGQAGVIGGVKVSRIRHAQGASSSNPIVVEDEDSPVLGRDATNHINPSGLIPPTNEEIVQVLINQKNIFPLLASIVKLLADNHPPPPPPPNPFQRRSTPQMVTQNGSTTTTTTITKKRKLNRVPAGAADWDVPYPFAFGEGPDSYRATWKQDRGKELIAQLIRQIKGASRKAATKKYIAAQKEKEKEEQMRNTGSLPPNEEPKVNGHYRPMTTTYGVSPEVQPNTDNHILKDASNSSQMHTSPVSQNNSLFSTNVSDESMSVTFDKLINSLVAATPNQSVSSNISPYQSGNSSGFVSPQDLDLSDANSINDDQALFDTWMHFLQAFPVAFDGMPGPSTLNTPSSSKCSTPTPDDFTFANNGVHHNAFHLPGAANWSEDFDQLLASMFGQPPAHSQSMDSSGTVGFNPTTLPQDFSSLPRNGMIDSNLLALPGLGHIGNDMQAYNGPFPPAISPVTSSTSFADTGPTTPSSVDWDMTSPEIFNNINENDIPGRATSPMMVDHSLQTSIATLDKGKQKETSFDIPIPSSTGVMQPSSSSISPVPPQSVTSSTTTHTLARKARKDDILRRVEEKKRALQQELDVLKIQLWETTVEQAALVNLVKEIK